MTSISLPDPVVVSVDPGARTCVVEPGIVLDELNASWPG
jgi:hypothetical protein